MVFPPLSTFAVSVDRSPRLYGARRSLLTTLVLAASVLIVPAPAQHTPFPPDQTVRPPRLEVTVPDFPAAGLILDIGGGGEGIIGRIKGPQVIAIDLSKQELEDAPGRPLLKIVMDACDLKFLDGTFPTATAFFTFMYVWPTDHPKILAEVYRVLQPGGRLLVWDVVFPTREVDPGKHLVLYELRIVIPGGGEVETGYGVHRLPPPGRGASELVALAKAAGFEIIQRRDERGWFFVELRKPESSGLGPH